MTSLSRRLLLTSTANICLSHLSEEGFDLHFFRHQTPNGGSALFQSLSKRLFNAQELRGDLRVANSLFCKQSPQKPAVILLNKGPRYSAQ